MSFKIIIGLIFLSVPLFLFMLVVVKLIQNKSIHQWQTSTRYWDVQFNALNIQIERKTVFLLYVVTSLLLVIYLIFIEQNILYAFISICCIAIIPKISFKILKVKRDKLFETLLPEALGQIAGSLRSGASLINAIDLYVEDTSGPVSEEFELFLKEYRLGQPMVEALKSLGQRYSNDNLTLVISTTLISLDLGGNLAETYERLGSTLQQKLMLEKKIDAFTSQGKLQGWVVGALPFGLIAILNSIEPESMGYIFTSWLGWGTLVLVAILEFFGMVLIRKIVNIDV